MVIFGEDESADLDFLKSFLSIIGGWLYADGRSRGISFSFSFKKFTFDTAGQVHFVMNIQTRTELTARSI